MDIGQAVELIVGAGGIGGGVKVIGQLTRIAVAIENLLDWKRLTEERLDEHQARLDKGGL